MRLPLPTLACLGACLLLLSGCGKDFDGFGESEGWGGYTKGFGNVDGYGNKQVGLCSYTGGCMQDSSDDEDSGSKSTTSKRRAEGSGDHAGSMGDSGSSQ